jgi:hypothetical protein
MLLLLFMWEEGEIGGWWMMFCCKSERNEKGSY